MIKHIYLLFFPILVTTTIEPTTETTEATETTLTNVETFIDGMKIILTHTGYS